jgi:hypothetical protein
MIRAPEVSALIGKKSGIKFVLGEKYVPFLNSTRRTASGEKQNRNKRE